MTVTPGFSSNKIKWHRSELLMIKIGKSIEQRPCPGRLGTSKHAIWPGRIS